MLKKIFVAGVLSLSFHGVASAGAIIGATEITQILNNIQLAMSYVEEAQQTITQINQYKTMLKNLEKMTPSAYLDQAAQKLWTDQNMYQTFKKLQTIVVNGQRMGYSLSNINTEFKRTHPGYGGFTSDYDFNKGYRDWSDTTLDSVKNAMAMAGLHAADFDTEQEMVRQLQSKSASADGQLEALQVGNQVGVAMVGQMQKLRQMSMAQMQAQNAHIAGQQSQQDAKKQAADNIFNQIPDNNRSIK